MTSIFGKAKKIGFVQVKRAKGMGLIAILCPSCANYFGLNTEFVERTDHVLYSYICPYCGEKHLLKNS